MSETGLPLPADVEAAFARGELALDDSAHAVAQESLWRPGEAGERFTPPLRLPDFDGETYVEALDQGRLGAQLVRVGKAMADGGWRTLAEIAAATGDPEASVSARLRDLRKRKFGGHTVERERVGDGPFRYRVVVAARARAWGSE